MKKSLRLMVTSLVLVVLFVALAAYGGVSNFDAVLMTATPDDTYQVQVKNSSGTSKFTVDSSGNVVAAGTLNVTGAATLGTAGITTGNITTGNITTGNITTAAIGTATVTGSIVGGLSGPVYGGYSTHSFTAHEDWTLSTAEAKTLLLICSSGDGTTASIVVYPLNAGQMFIVRNASIGSVTVKASGQTGATIATTKTAIVVSSGTDFYKVTADN